MSHESGLSARIIGQIALMQSVVAQFPDRLTMIRFVCHGLTDVTGVARVEYAIVDDRGAPSESPVATQTNETIRSFPVRHHENMHAMLYFVLNNPDAFAPYVPYVENFCQMLAVIMEEHRQREMNRELLEKLEKRVAERTAELEREIDVRRQAEVALRASREEYRNLVEHLPQRIFVKDGSSVYLSCNAAYADDLGIAPEDIVGKDDFAFYPSELATQYRADDRKVMDSGVRAEFEERYLVRNRWRWIRTIKVPFRGADGKTEGVLGIFDDITEKRQAEEALRESEQRFRAMFDNSNDGIVIAEVATRRLRYANPAICRMLDYSEADLLSRQADDLHVDAARPQAMDLFRRMASGETTFGVDVPLRRRDGTEIVCEVGAHVIEIQNLPCLMGVFRDVTRQRQLEEQLRQAEKMQAIGQLAGGVAHDFNNMLAVILGHSEIALEQFPADHDLHKNLAEIHRAAQRSAELTSQLLAYARKQTIMPRVLDLNQTIDGLMSMLRRLIGENITISCLLKAELWPVCLDPSQVSQILTNLAVNARDAISGTGSIVISTENVVCDAAFCREHGWQNPGDYVLVKVTDTGCGMGEETLSHLFEPFFTTKDVGRGTGLGLATVYGIVRQNNGNILVTSRPGKGSCFLIYLPRHDGPQAHVEPVSPHPETGGRETILLVEDEPEVLELTSLLLQRLGYCVLPESNPKRAVQLAAAHSGRIDLLMTDVVMPEMNGRELAKAIQAKFPELKCLYMSGYTADVIARQGVLEQDMHFIQKPFNLSQLATRIREALNGKR
ncbi:MAG TPA: PAS domain S-box protein, partial [Candidatus Ozemobacteraceae bacterium]|nr:PAS domain S-box protein [Candidatus Ozemobacteraceae bacterium]